jgi:hypothetical protein
MVLAAAGSYDSCETGDAAQPIGISLDAGIARPKRSFSAICVFGVAMTSARRTAMSPRTGFWLAGSRGLARLKAIASTVGDGALAIVSALSVSRSATSDSARLPIPSTSPARSWAFAASTEETKRRITRSRYGRPSVRYRALRSAVR